MIHTSTTHIEIKTMLRYSTTVRINSDNHVYYKRREFNGNIIDNPWKEFNLMMRGNSMVFNIGHFRIVRQIMTNWFSEEKEVEYRINGKTCSEQVVINTFKQWIRNYEKHYAV